MRKSLLLILIFCTNITAQKSWTLKECVERALEKNISIKQTELNFTEAELNKKNAIGNFIPNFNIGSSHSWNVGLNQDITTGILENITTQFTSMNLNVNVDVLNGLKNIKQLHLANLNILSNKFQLEDMKENVSLLVANSFLQILFNKELLKVQKIQYDLSIEDLSRAQELVENGVLPVGDLYEIEANKSSAEKSLIDAENALTLAKLALAQLILIENYQDFDIVDENYDLEMSEILNKSPDIIYNYAVQNKNEIRVAETNVEIAKKSLELNKSFLQPRL